MQAESGSELRFSIVVPTYNRRSVLTASMTALGRLETPWPVELIVVVDGSDDGSAGAARAVPMPFPVTVIEQPNAGAAAARNNGARRARGEYLLFLDDDMVADPRLLIEHGAVLDAGADAAVGHIPLHPDSPRTLLTPGVERWVRQRHERLTRTRGQLALGDLLTGQLSVRAEVFAAAHGFDEHFNAGGSFGAEDTDFLHRLLQTGAVVRYAPGAVTHQRYVVTPEQYLRQWRQAGRADAVLARKHPELAGTLAAQHGAGSLVGRLLRRWAPRVRSRAGRALAAPVVARARAGHDDLPTRWAFARVRDALYWKGSAETGGLGGDAPVVLAYHAIEDVEDAVVGPWCVGPELFERQLEALSDAGFTWIGLPDLLGFLDGAPLPPRAVLLTFDDGYASLLEHATPVLERHGIPALVLLVSDQVGGWNEWDTARGAAKLPLLTVAQLQEMTRRGWALGAHSRTHAHLTRTDAATLHDELDAPLTDLAAAGLPVQPVVAYPHGEHDARVRAAARRAGYAAAFALEGRTLSARSRLALPRIEVRRDTSPEALVAAALEPPRRPLREVERELRLVARRVLAAAGRGNR